MGHCPIDHSNYKNNGLITKVWGPSGWIFAHSVSFGYPLEPTLAQRTEYKQYFISLGHVLPCRLCRESYNKFITEGETALTDAVLENRSTLTKWLFDVHDKVNAKLEMDYGVTYSDVEAKYESFRARCSKTCPSEKSAKEETGCVAPLHYKAFSFKNLYEIDCPIIDYHVGLKIISLASKLYNLQIVDSVYQDYLKLVILLNGNYNQLKRLKSWAWRNTMCTHQIKYMRENAVPPTHTSGLLQNIPTIDEMKLILLFSSNLNRSELETAATSLEKIDV